MCLCCLHGWQLSVFHNVPAWKHHSHFNKIEAAIIKLFIQESNRISKWCSRWCQSGTQFVVNLFPKLEIHHFYSEDYFNIRRSVVNLSYVLTQWEFEMQTKDCHMTGGSKVCAPQQLQFVRQTTSPCPVSVLRNKNNLRYVSNKLVIFSYRSRFWTSCMSGRFPENKPPDSIITFSNQILQTCTTNMNDANKPHYGI